MASNTEIFVRKWNYCFLCQTNHKSLELSCPASSIEMKNNKQGTLDMYTLQVENPIELSKLNKLPPELQVDDLITATGVFEGCHDEAENKHDIPRIINIMAQIPILCWHKHSCRSSTDSRVVQTEKRKREINTPDPTAPSPVKKKLRSSSVGKSPNVSKRWQHAQKGNP